MTLLMQQQWHLAGIMVSSGLSPAALPTAAWGFRGESLRSFRGPYVGDKIFRKFAEVGC